MFKTANAMASLFGIAAIVVSAIIGAVVGVVPSALTSAGWMNGCWAGALGGATAIVIAFWASSVCTYTTNRARAGQMSLASGLRSRSLSQW